MDNTHYINIVIISLLFKFLSTKCCSDLFYLSCHYQQWLSFRCIIANISYTLCYFTYFKSAVTFSFHSSISISA